MESVRSFNSIVTDWLSRLASGHGGALVQGAQRFASLLAPSSELEVARELAHGHRATTLRMTSGLHHGASMELIAGEYVIGSGDACDIVLRGAEVAARHCRVTRGWSGMTVGDLRPGGAQSVAARRIRYDAGAIEVEYDVGGVQFMLRHSPPAQAEPHSHKHPASWRMLIIVIASVVVGLTFIAARGTVKQNPGAADNHRDNAHVSAVSPSDLVEEAQRALADEALRVELRNGRLLVEGRTSRTILKNRIHALAEDLRGTVAVEDRVEYVAADDLNSPGPLPVRIQGVMIGKPSYFLTDSGVRYFVGGVLPDGAEVLSIDAGAIQFRRGGRVIAYKLQ